MKYAQHFLLAMLMSGMMVIPGVAQSSGSGQQPQSSQSDQMQGSASNGDKAISDQQFIKKAAQDDMAEIKVAQLAQQKSNNNDVKQMAQQLMNDHQQNEQQIKQIAQQQNVTLPTQPDSKDKASYDRLSKLNGTEFDKAFIREQIRDHRHDVAVFQREQSTAKDQSVKQYAQQTLPKLQEHLRMVEQAGQKLGVNVAEADHSQREDANNYQDTMK